MGSIRTGKEAFLCASKTKQVPIQRENALACFLGDLKWGVFNSNRRGMAQIYAATVPEGMLKKLEEL